ncbi:MAG: site-specific DNA-methyltransferase [Rhodobacterales bacterium]|nr:site-specific DNA-methyltransferase [Rhodobacterales bacterium]
MDAGAARIEYVGASMLVQGDCSKILPVIGRVSAVVTDPPYGINISANPVRQKHSKKDWDAAPVGPDLLGQMRDMSDAQIIWGGNYFELPPSQGFLIWDKAQPQNFSLAQCELAWCSWGFPAKMFRRSVTSYDKEHPTQKPLDLMRWCLGFLRNPITVLDPFMGSGATGAAAVELGLKFIGIELDAEYFEVAARRIRQAEAQGGLFNPPPATEEESASLL